MKKSISVFVLFMLMITLAACSMNPAGLPIVFGKEGIAPYQLSGGEKDILRSFGVDDNSQIITFNAPKEASSLNVTVYRLIDGERWDRQEGCSVFIDTDGKSSDRLEGTFTMQQRENYVIECNINSNHGLASSKTEEVPLDDELLSFSKSFLEDFQDIKLDEEIPVAIMVYNSGSSIKGYSLQYDFDPDTFEGMDLIQVVTLKFSGDDSDEY